MNEQDIRDLIPRIDPRLIRAIKIADRKQAVIDIDLPEPEYKSYFNRGVPVTSAEGEIPGEYVPKNEVWMILNISLNRILKSNGSRQTAGTLFLEVQHKDDADESLLVFYNRRKSFPLSDPTTSITNRYQIGMNDIMEKNSHWMPPETRIRLYGTFNTNYYYPHRMTYLRFQFKTKKIPWANLIEKFGI